MLRIVKAMAMALVAILAMSSAALADGNGNTTGGGTSGGPAYNNPGDRDKDSKVAVRDWATSQLEADDGMHAYTPCPAGEVCPTANSIYLDPAKKKEGAGNPCTAGTTGCSSIGNKYYTCSAAATRNMVLTWNGVDKTELWFENKYNLNPSVGLEGINRITNLLNDQWGGSGSWISDAPSGARDYQAGVMTDVKLGQPVIQNVQTSYLPYFNGKALTHYNIASGFNRSAKTVGISEEWDPEFTFGVLPSSYSSNPYGNHPSVPRSAGYDAVNHSPNGKYVL